MRLIELPRLWTVIVDIIAWFIIHMAVVYALLQMPKKHFQPSCWLYKEKPWEKEGNIYLSIFKVRLWKRYLPDGAELFKDKGFPKKHLKGKNSPYLTAFQLETCRGELTHWIIMLFSPLFFLWNPFWVGWIMVFYATAENIPLIMTQRYNRHRLTRILEIKNKR